MHLRLRVCLPVSGLSLRPERIRSPRYHVPVISANHQLQPYRAGCEKEEEKEKVVEKKEEVVEEVRLGVS